MLTPDNLTFKRGRSQYCSARDLRHTNEAELNGLVELTLSCCAAHKRGASSLSDATDIFDAERLQEIITDLGKPLQPIAVDSRLNDIKHTLTLVDGSLISALPQIM